MQVTILTIGGDPEVHRTGCADIERSRQRSSNRGLPQHDYSFEASTITEIAEEYATDFLAEGSMTLESAVEWVKAGTKPCVALPNTNNGETEMSASTKTGPTTPVTTAKHVGPGEAASKGKRINEQKKVAVNKAKVDAINDKRDLPSRVDLIAEAQALGVEGPISRMKVKDLHAAIELKKALAVTPQRETGASASTLPPDATVTPITDAKSAKTNGAGGGRGTERGKQARAAAKAGRAAREKAHGKGRKVSDDELTAHVKAVLKAHPDAKRTDEHEYAYWVEGITHSQERFNKAWASAGGAA